SLAGQERWLLDAVSLAPTLDQLGLIAATPEALQRALALLEISKSAAFPTHVVVPTKLLSQCSAEVIRLFEDVVVRLESSGIRVNRADSEAFAEVDATQADHGTLVVAEIAAS